MNHWLLKLFYLGANIFICLWKIEPFMFQFSSVAQSCLTLRDPMDCSLPGSSIRGIFQARVLVWGISMLSSVQLLSRVWLCATPWIAARQASLSITISQSSLRLTSIESMMPSSHLILGCPLLLPPIPPSIRVFSNESSFMFSLCVLKSTLQHTQDLTARHGRAIL